MRATNNPFPVYDRLVTSGMLKPVPETRFVEAAAAFRLVNATQQLLLEKETELGPVRPPFPFMWLEGGPSTDAMAGTRIAIRIEPVVDDPTGFVMTFFILIGTPVIAPLRALVKIGPDGRMESMGYCHTAEDAAYVLKRKAEGELSLEALGANICAQKALFALSLMHCRNVKTELSNYQPKARHRRHSDRNRPPIEYHVITLPTPRRNNNGGGQGEATGTVKLHAARGHFKTYTAEKPLMGQHVGTYYWGWQMRGNPTKGEILSSYKVGADA